MLALDRLLAVSVPCLLAFAACTTSGGHLAPRLADGSAVPSDASYEAPRLLSAQPTELLGQIGSRGTRGTFAAELIVSEAGEVSGVRLLSGLGEADDRAIIEQLREWRFEPARLSDESVAVIWPVRFDFSDR